MHQNESQQLFRTNSIEEIKASYFKLKVTLLSYTNSNYSTLSIFTPSNSNPLLSCFYVNGSNPISSFIEFSCIAYFPKKKSIVMVGKDLSTCLLKLSTDSFITLKTSIVPSTSKHLLPIIIIRVPKYIQALSSKSRLKVEGRLKSIFSN